MYVYEKLECHCCGYKMLKNRAEFDICPIYFEKMIPILISQMLKRLCESISMTKQELMIFWISSLNYYDWH